MAAAAVAVAAVAVAVAGLGGLAPTVQKTLCAVKTALPIFPLRPPHFLSCARPP